MGHLTMRRTPTRYHQRLMLATIVGAVAVLGIACSDDDVDAAATTEEAARTSAPADAPHPAEATPATHEGDESATVDYLCPDGLTLTVEYGRTPATWATLELDGQRYHLEQAIAASGIRYEGVSSGYEVWAKGLEAMLHLDGELIEEGCTGTER